MSIFGNSPMGNDGLGAGAERPRRIGGPVVRGTVSRSIFDTRVVATDALPQVQSEAYYGYGAGPDGLEGYSGFNGFGSLIGLR